MILLVFLTFHLSKKPIKLKALWRKYWEPQTDKKSFLVQRSLWILFWKSYIFWGFRIAHPWTASQPCKQTTFDWHLRGSMLWQQYSCKARCNELIFSLITVPNMVAIYHTLDNWQVNFQIGKQLQFKVGLQPQLERIICKASTIWKVGKVLTEVYQSYKNFEKYWIEIRRI